MGVKVFRPAVRKGLLLHLPVALVLLTASVVLFILAFQERYGGFFILFLVVALLLLIPFLFVAYRTFALLRAGYFMERDGLRLHWGLRSETIPMPKVEWIKPISQIPFELPLPTLSFPGAILGSVHTRDQGVVEFMASDTDHLVLVATPHKIFAISPMHDTEFINEFRAITEMGSLTPIEASSTLPAGFLQSVWKDRIARSLILAGMLLTLGLLSVTSLEIPGRAQVSLGYDPSGASLPPVPAIRLLMIPSMCIFLYVFDTIAGLYFFRNENRRPVSYVLWSASALTPLLLLIPILTIK